MADLILRTEDRSEILAALMLDYAANSDHQHFRSKVSDFFKMLAEQRGLTYSWQEFELALRILDRKGALETHAHPGVETYVVVNCEPRVRAGIKITHIPGSVDFEQCRYLYSYVQLGAGWLEEALDALRVPDYPFDAGDTVVEGDGDLRLDPDDLTDETPVEALERAIVPASDRLVSLSDNQHETTQAIAALSEAERAVSASNSLDPDDRDEIVASLSAGETLLQRGRRIAGKTLKTLIFDPLKKAWQSATEESLKLIFLAAMNALVALIITAMQ